MKKIFIVLIVVVLAACIDMSEPVAEPESVVSPTPERSPVIEPSLTPESQVEPDTPPESKPEDTPGPEDTSKEIKDTPEPEETPVTTWKTASPEDHGLNPLILSEVHQYIQDDGRINSFLIVKNGYLVVEEYYNGYDQNSLHNIYSCTKSVMSALIGIAIDKKHIKSVHEKVLDFFPDYEFKNVNDRKKEITLEHLLTMTAGLKFDELYIPYTDFENPFIQMINADDWIKFVLDKPMVYDPGTVFNYSSGNSHVLSAILQRATGTTSLDYAVNHLFSPLGISADDIEWETDPQGVYVGGSWLSMRSRDMAKFGLLYLHKGIWNGRRIVPEEWVIKSTEPLVTLDYDVDYGYHWWVGDTMVYAQGYMGQFIYLLEDVDMVVVFTADVPESDVDEMFNEIIMYIIDAAKN